MHLTRLQCKLAKDKFIFLSKMPQEIWWKISHIRSLREFLPFWLRWQLDQLSFSSFRGREKWEGNNSRCGRQDLRVNHYEQYLFIHDHLVAKCFEKSGEDNAWLLFLGILRFNRHEICLYSYTEWYTSSRSRRKWVIVVIKQTLSRHWAVCREGGDLNQMEISGIYISTQELLLREEYQIGGMHLSSLWTQKLPSFSLSSSSYVELLLYFWV